MNDLQVLSMPDIERAAKWLAESKLFGATTWQQAATLMMIAQAEGIPAVLAARDYHIIQGRPSMKAEAMLARFLAAGGKVEWHERSDKTADATFSHPSGGTTRVNWTIEMARAAGLSGKEIWKHYPRALLHARCVSEGCRAVWPQATGVSYTPEEVRDMNSGEADYSSIADGPDLLSGRERDWTVEIESCRSEAELTAWWESTKTERMALPEDERNAVKETVIAHRKALAPADLNERLQTRASAAAVSLVTPPS
jgi:hypothetical protein